MGIAQSKEYYLPSGKNYSMSYIKYINVNINVNLMFVDNINLSNVIHFDNLIIQYPKESGILKLIYSAMWYKITNLGYSIKENISYLNLNLNDPLNECLDKIITHGFLNKHEDVLSDLIITKQCYQSNLNNIKYLLCNGNILVAGILIDNEFISQVLDSDEIINDIISDIIIIIGFNSDSLIIKTNWVENVINLNFSFIDNIKEICNFEIKSPEENYLNENVLSEN